MSKLTFLDNPWNLTQLEAETLWLLTELTPEQAAVQVDITKTLFHRRVQCARERLGMHTTQAVVEFDRWWQGRKRTAPDDVVHRLEIELFETAQLT